MTLIAGEFQQAASSYRKIAAQLEELPDERMEAMLIAIEQTQPNAIYFGESDRC